MAIAFPEMPFLSGPVVGQPPIDRMGCRVPQGELEASIPLAKVQEVLWMDYLKCPSGTHYNLTLKMELDDLCPEVEQLFRGALVASTNVVLFSIANKSPNPRYRNAKVPYLS